MSLTTECIGYVNVDDMDHVTIEVGAFDLIAALHDALEAAAPHLFASAVAIAAANNDHITPGGDGYSAGFHYALHLVAPDEDS